ncbi:MAG: ATP-binding cassette domain-containing protein [Verrucomicrobiales bacterium]|nr:ATP-binding cassette domain-containing protein [Verrucomicrobiales bacterium]
MIEVKDLTKRYAGRTAVDAISFEVEKGEVVGFLGPNGAGKSTTIRMLTCFLSASEGTAKVGGYDIYDDSIKVRQHIGYMPENVPLYPDMRVSEYLNFRAKIKGLRYREAKRAVSEAMDICSLAEVERKMVATLSKGYKQRVGLADALVNKPDLLILDEPTNGLDPNQIRQARELIKRLGDRHTILISTHILSEVEVTCGRVIIIDRGKIKASDSPQNLIRRLRKPGEILLEMSGDAESAEKELLKLDGVNDVRRLDDRAKWTSFSITTDPNVDVREDVAALIQGEKWKIRELASRAASLEDAFVDLVQEKRGDTAEGKGKGK